MVIEWLDMVYGNDQLMVFGPLLDVLKVSILTAETSNIPLKENIPSQCATTGLATGHAWRSGFVQLTEYYHRSLQKLWLIVPTCSNHTG